MSGVLRVALIFLTGALFIFAHEFGHYAFSEAYGLDPTFVYGKGDNSMLGMAVGVSHLATTPANNFWIILGATLLPLAILAALTAINLVRPSDEIKLMAEVFILLILINLVPLPGGDLLDANRLWHFVLG